MTTKRILSGMRPTGRLHIGHLSVLENWIRYQAEYECYYMVADWHALTTAYDETDGIGQSTREMVVDWLAAGMDPVRCAIFQQSRVPQHGELFLRFSMITPLSWLERVPTYKDQLDSFREQGKDIRTYGFLGYPLLQSADILVYQAHAVPVGEDQLPHIEMTREIARRFNHLYGTPVFPEPQGLVGKMALLPGTDGRKMSKSYGNEIPIGADGEEIWQKVQTMVTDPARIRKDDPGHPEVCVVFAYHRIYNEGEEEGIAKDCRAGRIGCFACKKRLAEKLTAHLAPIRERREALLRDPGRIQEVLEDGNLRAARRAARTLEEVRSAMKI